MQELKDESVGVVLTVGGGRLDEMCREVAAMCGEYALLCDGDGPVCVVNSDSVEVAS